MTAPRIDETRDPARTSWVEGAHGHADFPIQNLPLGVFSRGDAPRGGVAIGDHILDLAGVAGRGLLDGGARAAAEAASGDALNPLLALDASTRRALRRRVSGLLSDATRREEMAPLLHPVAECTLHLPARIGDYTAVHGGTCAYCDTPTLADCCIVPQLYSAERFAVPLDNYPRLLAMAEAMRALPAVEAAHPLCQPDADAA